MEIAFRDFHSPRKLESTITETDNGESKGLVSPMTTNGERTKDSIPSPPSRRTHDTDVGPTVTTGRTSEIRESSESVIGVSPVSSLPLNTSLVSVDIHLPFPYGQGTQIKRDSFGPTLFRPVHPDPVSSRSIHGTESVKT